MLRRVLAIIGIVLILAMYATAFLLAIFGNEHTTKFFIAAIATTIFVPILLWFYIRLCKLGDKKDK